MALLRGSIFITDDAFDGALLEECITHALMYRRDHGNRVRPDRLFVLQAELHALGATETRHAAQLSATGPAAEGGAPATMDVVTASRILKRSTAMVRRYCADGTLTAVKHRQAYVIDARSVHALATEQEQSAS